MTQEKLNSMLDKLSKLYQLSPAPPIKATNKAPADMGESPTSFDVEELDTLIFLDVACRVSLQPLKTLIESIYTPLRYQKTFVYFAKTMLKNLDSIHKEKELENITSSLSAILKNTDCFTLSEIFSIISLLSLLLSLCIHRADDRLQTILYEKTKQLLEMKFYQLRLMHSLLDEAHSPHIS